MKYFSMLSFLIFSPLAFSGTGCPFMACTMQTCGCVYNSDGMCDHNNNNCSTDYEVGPGCIETSCYHYCCETS